VCHCVICLCVVQCYYPHWVVGLTVCINGTTTPLSAMDLEPNFIPYYVRTNDTLQRIATRYNNTCNDVDSSIIPSLPSSQTSAGPMGGSQGTAATEE